MRISTPSISRAIRLAVTGALGLPVGLSGQGNAPSDPIPLDPAVTVGTLDNGLRYFVRENGRPENRAELRLVVDAGSILEDDDQLGLAHFVEHMAFNGTRNFAKQELVDYLESIGMQFGPDINAYTSFDETVYMLQFPLDDPSVLETGFQILEDWAHGVAFEPEEVDKERGVVTEEWRLGRGAQARMLDAQFPILFEASRYAERLPIGKREVLASADPSVLERFYRDWYRPELMAVIAVGDFDGDVIEGLIRRHFDGLQTVANPRPRVFSDVPLDHPARVAIATDVEATQSQVAVMYKQPLRPRGTVADFRRGLAEGLYEGMMNGRLEEIAQQADPPFLFAGSGGGSFVRSVDLYQLVALVPEGGIARGLDGLLTEAERVVRYGFTDTELERQKTDMKRAFERRFAERENQESDRLASRYIQVFLRELPFPSVEQELELVDVLLPGITLEKINALAGDWLREEGRVVLANAPEKAGLDTPAESDLAGVFAVVDQRELDPYEDSASDEPLLPTSPTGSPVVSEETTDEVDVTVWTLDNGVRVVLKPTDFKDDEVLFAASSPGGTSLASDDDFVSASWASTVVERGGIGDFDLIDLEKKLTGQVLRVSPFVSGLTEGFNGMASPQDLETALQLVYLYFDAPRKDETAFMSLRSQMMGLLANRGADPGAVFSDTVSLTMSQGHPRVRPVDESVIEEIDLDRSFAFYEDRFADASDFTFYFVGAFDPEELRPLVELYIGGLPSTGRVEDWRDVGIDPPEGVVEKVVRKGLEPQSQTRIIFAGDAEYSGEEEMALSALGQILDIRLREVLREDLGGTYGVGVSGSLDDRPDEEFEVRISFGSDPERADELAQVVFEEIDRIQQDGPDAETVDKVRETQRRSKETSLQENRYWLGRIQRFERLGLDFEDIPSYESVEAWTPEQIQDAAIRYLRDDQYVKITLLPERQIP